MKGLNIMGIIIAVATFAVAGYYFELINSARWRPYWDDSYYGPSAADITAEAGLVFLVISGFMVYQLITNLVKIKTITTKVLGIIGISLIGLAFLWNLIMLADPRGISFDEGEDGILTAQEVSNLDLRNTKLVVLSACETGLGDIKGSEGVFGLQRAFKMAGAEYLIMSLWQVPDKETAEFMELFYKNLVKLKDISNAFSATQKVMREKYDPYYWAAFVLIE